MIVAAFDFDKTITTRDTLLPFLFSTTSCHKALMKSLTLLPTMLRYKGGLLGNHAAKEKLLTTFLQGYDFSDLLAKADLFAKHQLCQWVRPTALKRIHWHQQQGHRCVLVSAGLEIYLAPWAKSLGFDEVLATRLLTDQRTVTGKMEGHNCFGEEKVHRLLKAMGPKEKYMLYAYGDSRGDKELLALADHAFYRVMPE